MFGAILSYIMLIGSLCENILLTYVDAHWYTSSIIWSIILVGFFVVPLSCIRDFGHLAYVSGASVATLAGTVLVVIIVGSLNLKSHDQDQLSLESFQGSVRMLGTVVYAFNYAAAIFQAYSAIQKEDRNIKTFTTIAKWTSSLGVLLSFIFGLMGYLIFREGKYQALYFYLLVISESEHKLYLYSVLRPNPQIIILNIFLNLSLQIRMWTYWRIFPDQSEPY